MNRSPLNTGCSDPRMDRAALARVAKSEVRSKLRIALGVLMGRMPSEFQFMFVKTPRSNNHATTL